MITASVRHREVSEQATPVRTAGAEGPSGRVLRRPVAHPRPIQPSRQCGNDRGRPARHRGTSRNDRDQGRRPDRASGPDDDHGFAAHRRRRREGDPCSRFEALDPAPASFRGRTCGRVAGFPHAVLRIQRPGGGPQHAVQLPARSSEAGRSRSRFLRGQDASG